MHLRAISDLDIARKDVKEKGFALSIVRNGNTIFQSKTPGISALVTAIDKDRFLFKGASAADQVLGRAAAMLLLYSEIVSIFASTASSDALAILKRFKIPVESERVVPAILNRNQTSTCPFESLVRDVENPEEAFNRLRVCKISD
jgi:hypothetical protein